uniref:Secreted protein n=1 Tax=Mesocestoides corti TaxID=53468 RepID=A0A5K3FPJ1_MESCO
MRSYVYIELRSQLCGLGWVVLDVLFRLVIGQQSLICCTNLLHARSRVFYTPINCTVCAERNYIGSSKTHSLCRLYALNGPR